MSNENVRVEHEGHIATIVLARPEARNAMTEAMGDAFERAIGELRQAADVRAVLIRGEGAAFCAGGDLGFIEARTKASADDNRRAMRRFYERFLSVRTLRAPVIAVMHGAAMGAGVCLALACDMRLAAQGTRLGLNFVRLGLPPGMGATLLLPRIVGPSKAAALMLTGKTIDADEALRIGLVDAVHPAADVLAAARATALEIAAGAPGAVAATARALRAYDAAELDTALDAEAEAQAVEYASADLLEGVRAARERRAPSFRGR
jgi:enoyl-CoA hydratase